MIFEPNISGHRSESVTSIAASLMEIPRPLVLQRILITDHDPATQARLQHLLSAEGYGVEIVTSWTECRERLRATPIAVLVLDQRTVDIHAARSYEDIRALHPGVSIIVLSTRSSVIERVLSLELGADDYIVKPFDGRELVARVRAAIRRSQPSVASGFRFGDVVVDFRTMVVKRQGIALTFTAQEFKVLKFMTQNAGRVLSREELLNAAWGYFSYPTTRTVDNHILKLRQKLEPDPSNPVHFLTIHCVGYKFVPHPERAASSFAVCARDSDHARSDVAVTNPHNNNVIS